MAGPPGGLLALVILLVVSGVISDEGPPKWSQRTSKSNGGWIPIEAPCLTCRAAAEASADMDVQASSVFSSAVPVKPPAPVVFRDSDDLRPPPAPLRVQRQEIPPHRPILDSYIENQRPPPPPIVQPTAGKQGRDHRFLYTQNLPRQQFQGFPPENQQHIQQQRVVFPTHQIQTQDNNANVPSVRQQAAFLNQQLQHQLQPQQQSIQQQQSIPHKQIRLQSIPHDQFPLVLPPAGLGAPHGFQSPNVNLVPVPHSPQPTAAQVDLQTILQQQLQGHLHHQINQQLLGSPFATPFPTSGLGQPLQFHTRNNPIPPTDVRLIPQNQQILHPVKNLSPAAQQLDTKPSPKPNTTPLSNAQADSPRVPQQKERQKHNLHANNEEDIQEEVQLVYVPVEALRQRDRVNKQVSQTQKTAPTHHRVNSVPDRQLAHSFEVQHFQNPGKRPFIPQNTVQQHKTTPAPVTSTEAEQFETENIKANHGQETVVREEKLLSFTPPRVQQFHDNVQYQTQGQSIYPNGQFPQQIQTENYQFQNADQLQQQEQQAAFRHQIKQNTGSQKQQVYRPSPQTSEDNSQRYYQDARQESSHTTSRPVTTSSRPTYTSTQPAPSSTLAPYQPPLSVYMEDADGQGTTKLSVDDVLRSLNGAKSVPVLERAGPNPPKVFVGPSVLRPPKGYAKFELPYLSMLDSNRVERKVDRLPFFVAPLSFQPPPGYAKIPFPAPHVGSVVVSSTPVASTTERSNPLQQSSPSTALPELVNSLQASNVSPPNVEYVQAFDGAYPVSSTQQPRLQQELNQQVYQRQPQLLPQIPPQLPSQQQPSYNEQEYQQRQNYRPQSYQQPTYQQQLQENQQLQHQQSIDDSASTQQNINNKQEPHQEEPLPPTFTLYNTESPSPSPLYYSTTTTSTTTTPTTTVPPQTRAPAQHSRGRTRQRTSYTQAPSTDSENNYRNRGSSRGSASSESTRQPSTRTRRPWDGRRRPSTTTPEPSSSSDSYSFNNAQQNFIPETTPNEISSSTVRSPEFSRDVYSGQNVRGPTPEVVQQQYSSDESFPQPASDTQGGQLRGQGAVVLSAFQQPQVLGDVITGQIQRPENNNAFRNYYDGQREYTVSTYDSTLNFRNPVIQPTQTSVPQYDQISSVQKAVSEEESTKKDDPRKSVKSKGSERVTAYSGEKNDGFSNAQQPRGQKYVPPQVYRESVVSQRPKPESFRGEGPITQAPYVESQFGNPNEQTNEGTLFRNFNQRPESFRDQSLPIQNVYSTQFTPSIQLSDNAQVKQSTPLPEISNSSPQQPQYFIISTPIPNPVRGINRTFVSEQNYESQQPFGYSQAPPSPKNLPKQNEQVAVLVNEGLSSPEPSRPDQFSGDYKFPDTSAGTYIEETPVNLPKRVQTTTTEQSVYDIEEEAEPKRTRYRLPQKITSETVISKGNDNTDTTYEETPRYRPRLRNNAETRTRQSSQRTRGRHYTTESPSEDEIPSQPQRTQFSHQRFRGRQRATASASSVENTQNSDNARGQITHQENYPVETTHSNIAPVVEETLQSSTLSEDTGENFESKVSDTSLRPSDDQGRKTERYHQSVSHAKDSSSAGERPVHVRSRGRFRGAGDRIAVRQRGQIVDSNVQEPNLDSHVRNPTHGQRYQNINGRNPVLEESYQEPPRDHPDEPAPVVLSFDAPQQKAAVTLGAEDQKGYSDNPVIINTYEVKGLNTNVNGAPGFNGYISQENPINHVIVNEHFEQTKSPIDTDGEFQDPTTTPIPVATFETTTPSPVTAKPGRKYGNFVSRVAAPRRQSHVTASLNSVPTTAAPDTTHSNKVYTVRPARRPTVKPTATTRIRIRRPTTPTTTTTTTTPEPSYFLTTPPSVSTQPEYSTYDPVPSFGNTRGGLRARKRPLVVSRRPVSPSSNEVHPEEQDDETSRPQSSYRQRTRGSSRRVSASSTERAPPRWRQLESSSADEHSETVPISQSAQGFRSEKGPGNSDRFTSSQENVETEAFQISLPEDQLASHIPTKALRTQGKVRNSNQRPVYQSEEQYYSQEPHQPHGVQENPLKYHNPPVRPSSFVAQDNAEYSYQEKRPQSSQQNEQTRGSQQQKEDYQDEQQGFVLNFSGLSRAEDSLYPQRDELESGEETRYFDKIAAVKSNEKPSQEKQKTKVTKPHENQESADSVPAEGQVEDIQSESIISDAKSPPAQQEEPVNTENKEAEKSAENSENPPLKKVLGGRRRGNWVRVRTKVRRPRPGDTLETAESQNLASVSQNLLQHTTPLKDKSESLWMNAPLLDDSTEKGQADTVPVEEAVSDETFVDVTEPSVDISSDSDQTISYEDHKEDTDKQDESVEDVFEDLENGDFSPSEKDNLDDGYDTKEKSHLSSASNLENASESSDIGSEESKGDEIPVENSKIGSEELIDDSLNSDEKSVVPQENSTEQAEDDYVQELADVPEKSDAYAKEDAENFTDQPTPRVLGTSTTTEISLETEICYRGRCVKTKVDTDQVPTE